jgi:hypothetical protein
MPGQYASWPVTSRAASVAYRCFRVLLTGPNAGHTAHDTFPLSYMELYGYFFRERAADAQ